MKISFRISKTLTVFYILLLNIVNNHVLGLKVLTSERIRYVFPNSKFRAELRLLSTPTDSIDPIDPLDESSDLRRAKYQPKRTKNEMVVPSNQENKLEKTLQTKSNGNVKQKGKKGFKTSSNVAVSNDLDKEYCLAKLKSYELYLWTIFCHFGIFANSLCRGLGYTL
jgi:hypothetical protein